jgi:hypothetical protein
VNTDAEEKDDDYYDDGEFLWWKESLLSFI